MKFERCLILAFAVFFSVSFVSAAADDSLHFTIQTRDAGGSVEAGTFGFAFNISTSADCNNVLFTDTTTLATDSRGIISYYLDSVSLDYTEQYYLCYYRDGTLKSNSKIARVPYSFNSKFLQGAEKNAFMPFNTSVTGNFNFNGGILTAGQFLGLANNSDKLDALDSSAFMPFNTSVVGDFDFNGGAFTASGLSIKGGDLYAQTVFTVNLSNLDVTNLNINGSILPQFGLDNSFDLGSSSLRWKDIFAGGAVTAGSFSGAGTGLTGTAASLTAGIAQTGDSATSFFSTGTVEDARIAGTITRDTEVPSLETDAAHDTCSEISGCVIGAITDDTSVPKNHIANSGTLSFDWADSEVSDTLTASDVVCTDCIGTTEIADSYVLNTGDTATGDYIFDTDTFFIDSLNNRIGIGTLTPTGKLEVFQSDTAQMGVHIQKAISAENTASGLRVYGYSPSIELIDKDLIQNWYIGIDDNDANKFLIGKGYGPGQGLAPALTIDTSNNIIFGTTTGGNDRYEFEDGSVCIGTGGCIAPNVDGRLLLEGSLTAGRLGSTVIYHSFGSLTPTPESGSMNGVSDVYIQEDLEVDGTFYLTGGSGAIVNADIAEMLLTEKGRDNTLCEGDSNCVVRSVEKELEFGDLVCINPNIANTIIKCNEANLRLAVGFVSNTSVMEMGNLKYGYPVAVAGIVWSKVTTENGNINPGDLLVSSSKPGYAMKNNYPLPGVVVGKAFDFCYEDECNILSFVALS